MRRKFWMVLGDGQPTHRHSTKEDAAKEAERLAQQNHHKEFTVLEAMATVRYAMVRWEERIDTDEPDIPF